MPLRSVAVLLPERPAPFEFGVLCEVFGIDRSDDGVPPVDFRVCAREPGVPIETGFGLAVVAHHGYDAASGADVVAVPALVMMSPSSTKSTSGSMRTRG